MLIKQATLRRGNHALRRWRYGGAGRKRCEIRGKRVVERWGWAGRTLRHDLATDAIANLPLVFVLGLGNDYDVCERPSHEADLRAACRSEQHTMCEIVIDTETTGLDPLGGHR